MWVCVCVCVCVRLWGQGRYFNYGIFGVACCLHLQGTASQRYNNFFPISNLELCGRMCVCVCVCSIVGPRKIF